jgi:hypothetical protein
LQLAEWSERPCVLTIAVPAASSRLRVAGILRAYYSLASMHGWALVPPEQHGGFTALRMTELCFDRATMRAVIDSGPQRQLRYALGSDAVFTLERDEALLTGPPRATREGRYLYVGGRRRRVPEPWMFA